MPYIYIKDDSNSNKPIFKRSLCSCLINVGPHPGNLSPGENRKHGCIA